MAIFFLTGIAGILSHTPVDHNCKGALRSTFA